MSKGFIDEIARIKGDRVYVFSLIILPAMALIFFVCFFSKSDMENLPIAVFDNDKSTLSRSLVEMIDSTAAVSVEYQTTSSSEGLELILDGRAYAVVLIPNGFEAEILSGGRTHIELYNTGTNISTNGFIERDIQTTAESFSAGVAIKSMQAVGESYDRALATAMPIRIETHALFNPYMNYAYYLAPCFMALMIAIFSTLTTIYVTYGRGLTALTELISACLPTTITMTLFSAIMLFVLFGVMGVPLKGSITAIAVANILLITTCQAIGVFFVGISKSMHTALSLGGGYSVAAFTLSGFTFPVVAMAAPLQFFSHLFPFTYYMDIFINCAMRGADIATSLPQVGYMTLFLILPLFVHRRL